MLALYQDYCVCANTVSPSGRLTYWGVLNTWRHPSKMSNKRSHYQTIQLLYKRPVCPWMAVHCALAQKRHLQVRVLFPKTSARNNSMDRGTCGTTFGMNLLTQSYILVAYVHLLHICCTSPATICVWWPSETLHTVCWHFLLYFYYLNYYVPLFLVSQTQVKSEHFKISLPPKVKREKIAVIWVD